MAKVFTPYFMVKDAQNAIKFYESIFKGDIKDIQYASSIEGFEDNEEAKNNIIHSSLDISGNTLFLAEDNPKHPFFNKKTLENNIQMFIEFDSLEEQLQIYNQLKTGGVVIMELDQTWGGNYGVVKDKFGVIWQLNYNTN